MVRFGVKTEPNRTGPFAKFKITEPNCLHFELNRNVPNRTKLLLLVPLKKYKKPNEIEF